MTEVAWVVVAAVVLVALSAGAVGSAGGRAVAARAASLVARGRSRPTHRASRRERRATS